MQSITFKRSASKLVTLFGLNTAINFLFHQNLLTFYYTV